MFMSVAEELNFRRAAERLFIDQSALSRRIAGLEAGLGFALFKRTTRDVQLTDAGRVLYEEMTPLLLGFGQAVETARAAAQGKRGRLSLAYMSFAAPGVLPDAVRRFAGRYPDVALTLTQMRTQAQKLALSREEIDAGFMLGPFQNPQFHQRPIRSERLVALAPADHPLASQTAVTLADIAAETLILGSHEQWDFFRILIEDVFAARRLPIAATFEPSDAMGILGLVAGGLGVSIYVEGVTAFQLPGIAPLPIIDCDRRIETILCWRRDNRNPALARFVDVLSD
jgi:LysR family transcriptional regulator, benzoate and cis,cis-muconate-responsive activator of ben and cat genes